MNARRAWIVDQLAAFVRNGAIPKDDQWVQTVLDWLALHGLFVIKKKAEKSKFVAVRVCIDSGGVPRRHGPLVLSLMLSLLTIFPLL
jgi:hypothetical protein